MSAGYFGVSLNAKLMQVRETEGPYVKNARDLVKAVKDAAKLGQEAFLVVTLNQKNRLIDKHLVSLGTLTASLVHPREVFRPAIVDGAAAIAFVHNHPSGDTTPSHEDRVLIKRLKECAELLGIRLLDSVIVGDGYLSMQEEGIL